MKKALVVGAGPAGLSAALGLIKIGFETMVLEQRPEKKPRVCGTFLNSEAVSHLHWLDVARDLRAAGAVSVLQTRVTTPHDNPSDGHPSDDNKINTPGLALSRPALESCLSQKALQEGALVQFGSRVIDFQREKDQWMVQSRNQEGRSQSLVADLLILADGRFSFSQGSAPKAQAGWFGWNATFSGVPQDPGEQSLHFFPGGYVGVVTYHDGSSNVCGLIHKKSGALKIGDEALREAETKSPALKFLLQNAKRENEWLGVGPLPYSLHMRKKEGLVLAGDAAAVGDPFMGEGIGRALGAGPMMVAVHKNLQSAGNFSLPHFVRSYEALWKKHYTARLWIGFLSRKFLAGPLPFKWGMALIHKKPAVNFLTPFFHAGFRAS